MRNPKLDDFSNEQLLGEVYHRYMDDKMTKILWDMHPVLKDRVLLSSTNSDEYGETYRAMISPICCDYRIPHLVGNPRVLLYGSETHYLKSIEQLGKEAFTTGLNIMNIVHPRDTGNTSKIRITNWVPEEMLLMHPNSYVKYRQMGMEKRIYGDPLNSYL